MKEATIFHWLTLWLEGVQKGVVIPFRYAFSELSCSAIKGFFRSFPSRSSLRPSANTCQNLLKIPADLQFCNPRSVKTAALFSFIIYAEVD